MTGQGAARPEAGVQLTGSVSSGTSTSSVPFLAPAPILGATSKPLIGPVYVQGPVWV
jgi:hypothetical protein